jgi:hypothetical protein
MSRKARERLFKQFREDVERFSPNDESLTRGEVQDMLRAAGTDPDALREWLNTTARALANARRAEGKVSPEYLLHAIDLSSPADKLPRDEKTALQKAREWIRSLTEGPGVLTDDLEIIRAYRSRGEVSEEDQRLLDAAEAQLREELKKKSDG